MTRKIETSCWAKPIPDRSFDWEAVYEDYDYAPDGPSHPIGYGRTEAEAIADLKMQCPDEDNDGLDTGSNATISAAQQAAR